MAARPFKGPARDKKKKQARALVVERLNAALKKSQSK
jgi:ribosomal protein L20